MAFMVLKGGMTNRARRKAFDAIFARFDHNQNGKVFINDFVDELRMVDVEVDEEEIRKLSAIADDEGQITKDDFKLYCHNSEMYKSLDKNNDGIISDIEMTSKAELAFKALDRNSDGFISRKEFTKISKNLTKEQVDAVLTKFDSDGDGKLDYSEFKKLLKR